jgi:hypothetical protein
VPDARRPDLGPFGIRVNSTFMGWMWGAPVIGYFKSEAQRLGVTMRSQRVIALTEFCARIHCTFLKRSQKV